FLHKCCNSNRTSSIKNTFLYSNRLIEIMQFELRNLSNWFDMRVLYLKQVSPIRSRQFRIALE
ncbi:MAG: hypothetical protein OXE41_03845, partial [Gammaproteobacteria bacterium]|nr:hypothetical protein [Gammaproteobacteria bacterium]